VDALTVALRTDRGYGKPYRQAHCQNEHK
jgi:hypothetical protein